VAGITGFGVNVNGEPLAVTYGGSLVHLVASAAT
jgi:hypothetical protein